MRSKGLARTALWVMLPLAIGLCAWGFVGNSWAASFHGPNADAYLRRGQAFLAGLLVSLALFLTLGVQAAVRWMRSR